MSGSTPSGFPTVLDDRHRDFSGNHWEFDTVARTPGWLIRVARTTSLSGSRSDRRRPTGPGEAGPTPPSPNLLRLRRPDKQVVRANPDRPNSRCPCDSLNKSDPRTPPLPYRSARSVLGPSQRCARVATVPAPLVSRAWAWPVQVVDRVALASAGPR